MADDDTLYELFAESCLEQLRGIETAILDLESAPTGELSGRVAAIFRAAHTIKGDAGAIGAANLAALAHGAESVLELMRRDGRPVDGQFVGELLGAFDDMRAMAEDARNDPGRDIAERLARLAALARDTPADVAQSAEADAETEAEPEADTDKAPGPAGTFERIRKLAIPAVELDVLVDRVGELGIAQSRLSGLAIRRVDLELRDVAEEVERLSGLLRDQVLGLRLLPIKVSFPKYRRLVRDACASLGKAAALVMEGENTKLDKAVIEQLNAPCIHLLRNAVDHGIEPAEVRSALGKPPQGTVTLSARQEGSDVVIAVRDDGGGIDGRKLWTKAVEAGRIEAGRPFDPAAALELIFLPGLSTAEAVSDVSGRGVGMDAVRETIAALRGRLDVQSVQGVGSTFTIRLPVSLAIIDCLEVRCDDEAYYLHLDYVEECLELPASASLTGTTGFMELRGVPMPLLSLRRFFDLDQTEAPKPHVVTVRRDGGRAGLVVDAVIGRKQAVLKHLGRTLGRIEGVLGGTVTEAGDMALVLDVPGLLAAAKREHDAHHPQN